MTRILFARPTAWAFDTPYNLRPENAEHREAQSDRNAADLYG